RWCARCFVAGMTCTRFVLLALSLLIPVAMEGCAADAGDDDNEDQESEPMAETSALISSGIDCKTESMKAYDNGKPYTIEGVHIGAKRVSKTTGHAFLKMQQAADKAGVKLSINSGFRTQEEQEHLYNCYKTGSCNNGNLAAKPGFSNHQNGRALDLTTS